MLPYQETNELHAIMDVAERLSLAIERAGINQTEFAEAAGVSKGYISRVLSGDENLTIANMVKLFNATGCRFDLLITPKAADEWYVKRLVECIEGSFWQSFKEAPLESRAYTSSPQWSIADGDSDACLAA